MPDLPRIHNSAFDRHSNVNQLAKVLRYNPHSKLLGFTVRIERTAKRDVILDFSNSAYVDRLLDGVSERWNILESHAANSLAIHSSPGSYPPCRCVHTNYLARFKHSGFKQNGHQRDNAMAAHSAVTLIVHEEHAKILIGCNWFSQYAAVHISVASRLKHQSSPKVVEILLGIPSLSEDGIAGDRGHASGNDTQRFSSSVRIDSRYAGPVDRRNPVHLALRIRCLDYYHCAGIWP